jgi:hypothetical protein
MSQQCPDLAARPNALATNFSPCSAVTGFGCEFEGAIMGFQSKRYRPELHYMRGPGPKWHEKNTAPVDFRPGFTAAPFQLGDRRHHHSHGGGDGFGPGLIYCLNNLPGRHAI